MSEIPNLKLDCWLKQICKWWHDDMWPLLPGSQDDEACDQWWGEGGCPCSWRCPCQSWSGQWFSQSGLVSIIIVRLDDMIRNREWRVGSEPQYLSQSRRMLKSWGGWKNEREIVARNKNMCCEQNIKADKTNIEHCLWSSCLLRGIVMSSDLTRNNQIVVKPSC